ncbi:MAG: hypothetical protein ACOYN0_15645 [Phycisphaerales bacterium]
MNFSPVATSHRSTSEFAEVAVGLNAPAARATKTNTSAFEMRQIEAWLSREGLNAYGDPEGTMYLGGTPLYNESTGRRVDRFDYIRSRHPEAPWLLPSWAVGERPTCSTEERTRIDAWLSRGGLNSYGDPAGTVYAGGTPLFDESTGRVINRYDYIRSRHGDSPWNSLRAPGHGWWPRDLAGLLQLRWWLMGQKHAC